MIEITDYLARHKANTPSELTLHLLHALCKQQGLHHVVDLH